MVNGAVDYKLIPSVLALHTDPLCVGATNHVLEWPPHIQIIFVAALRSDSVDGAVLIDYCCCVLAN